MLQRLRAWLQQIPIADPAIRQQALILQALLLVTIVAGLLSAPLNFAVADLVPGAGNPARNLILATMGLLALIPLRRGRLHVALALVLGLIIVGKTVDVASVGINAHGALLMGYVLPILLAGLLLSSWQTVAIALVCIASALVGATLHEYGLAWPSANGLLRFNAVFTLSLIAGLITVLITQFRRVWRQSVAAAASDEQRLRLALDAGGMGTWDWDLRSGTIVWGGHHASILGVPEGAFDGRYESFARSIHPEDLPTLEAAVEQARLTHRLFKAEYRVLWPDGGVHWAAGQGRFFYDAHGNPTRMTGVIQEITERKRAEAQLLAANAERDRLLERLQLVLDQMPVGCVLSDAAWVITAWNPAAERMFGFTAAEMIGTLPEHRIITPKVLELLPSIRAAITGSHTVLQAISENRTRDGRIIVCEWSNMPLRDAGGRFVGFLSMVQDVTERAEQEREIRRLNSELEARVVERTAELAVKNRELELFTYSVSHDLKAPLRGLDGYSRLLLEDYGPQLADDGKLYVETIRKATLQMGALIDDLLAYSRVERRPMHPRVVDVAAALHAILAERDEELREREVRLAVELPAGRVRAEHEGVAHALRNLIDNALKFTRACHPPVLEIGGRLEDGRYLLWVRDNGPGFAMEYHDRIFEIFQRLHRVEEFPGTGVGLAIVRKAMERMGGQVWAMSSPGAGATFFLSLPLAPEEGA